MLCQQPKLKRPGSLEERIGDMDRENSKLLERVSVAEVENALLLKRHSTSHASEFPDIPRERYEDWILVEDRLDVILDLKRQAAILRWPLRKLK